MAPGLRGPRDETHEARAKRGPAGGSEAPTDWHAPGIRTGMDDGRLLGEIAQGPLFVLSTSDTVGQTLEVAREKNIHHFPVKEKDELAGFVCVCDLIGASDDTPVGLVMAAGASVLADTATLVEAAELMKRSGRGSVLVRGEDGVFGIVTRADVVASSARADELLSERCDCCGLDRHLRTLDGRTLCAFCQGSTTERDWLRESHPTSR